MCFTSPPNLSLVLVSRLPKVFEADQRQVSGNGALERRRRSAKLKGGCQIAIGQVAEQKTCGKSISTAQRINFRRRLHLPLVEAAISIQSDSPLFAHGHHCHTGSEAGL